MYKIISNRTQRLSSIAKKILFFAVFVTVTNWAVAQDNPTVKMPEGRITVAKAMKSIEAQTNLKFSYDGAFDRSRRIDLPADPTPLSVILNKMLEGTNRAYSISGKFILIKLPAEQPKPVSSVEYEDTVSQVVYGRVSVAGNNVYSAVVTAIERTAGSPKHFSTTTGNDGKFSFGSLPEGSYLLLVSHPDYGMAELLFEVTKLVPESFDIELQPVVVPVNEEASVHQQYISEPLPLGSVLAGADPGLRFITPRWAVKTNLLHDITTTINLGVEFRVGKMWTIDIPVSYNPWTFSDNRKIKSFTVQPELRRWINEPFNGHFFGINATCKYFNMGGVKVPLLLLENLENMRYEGSAWGAGISYGYQWMLSKRWSMEATFGIGYAYIDYRAFDCRNCGYWQEEGTKHYFGPTKLGISLIYIFR